MIWAMHWSVMGQTFLAFGWNPQKLEVWFVEDGRAVERARMEAFEALIRHDGFADVHRRYGRWPVADVKKFGVKVPPDPGRAARRALARAARTAQATAPAVQAATSPRSARQASQ